MGQMWYQIFFSCGKKSSECETVLSKLKALVGQTARMGVPFTPVDQLMQNGPGLHSAGYPALGRERLYSGITGEPLDGLAFVGCVFYQRLRHMSRPSPAV